MRTWVWPILLLFLLSGYTACRSDVNSQTQSSTPKPIAAEVKQDTPTAAPSEEELAAIKAKEAAAQKEAEALAKQKAEEEAEKLEEERKRKERRKRRAERRAEEKRKELERQQEQEAQAVETSTTYIPYTEPEKVEPAGKLQFNNRNYDFGRIKESDTLNYKFQFFNVGEAPIVISNVKASCGCTQTTYPKEPIMPGEKGAIGVTFDSKGKLGKQKPFISVTTNGSPKIYSLSLEGLVDTDRE